MQNNGATLLKHQVTPKTFSSYQQPLASHWAWVIPPYPQFTRSYGLITSQLGSAENDVVFKLVFNLSSLRGVYDWLIV